MDELNKAIGLLYETALCDESWPGALQQLASAFNSFGVGHFFADGPTLQTREFHGYGHDPLSVRLYCDHYHALDPGLRLVCRSTPGQWLPEEVMLPRSLASCREYLHDYALPNGIGATAGGRVPIDGLQGTLVFTVQRRPGAEPFGEAESQMFSVLASHLSAVARMTDRVRILTFQERLAQAALDRLQAGVIVVDAGCRAQLVNAAASKMLQAGSGFRMLHGRIHCEAADCDAQLHLAVAAACSASPRGGGVLVRRPVPVTPLHVGVLPVPAAHQLASFSDLRLALVVISDPEATVGDARLYRALFNLTVAESELLVALVCGTAPQEYAERRKVGITTVRTHLRSVMEKCHCNSQAKLVAYARSLPSVS